MIASVNCHGAASAARGHLPDTSTAPKVAHSSGHRAAIAARNTRLVKLAARAAATGLMGAGRSRPRAARTVARRFSCAGYAGAATSSSKSTSKASAASVKKAEKDPLAFLRDSKLSIEEKLMRLLAHLDAQWEKDMQKQLDAFKGGPGTSGSSKSKAAKSGGEKSLFGNAVGAAKQFLPGVGFALDALQNPAVRSVARKIGGPVLAAAATAMGYPALAPALLKYAPAVIDAAADVATALEGVGSLARKPSSGTKAGGSSGSRATSKSGGTTMSASEQQLAFMEIQRLREKQKEMFALVSNTLKSGHDLRMGVIANLR